MRFLFFTILFISNTLYSIDLSDDEKNYLIKNKSFTVCSQSDYFPLSSEKDNKLLGIGGDLFYEISQILDIKFKALSINSKEDFYIKVNENKCDFISNIKRDSKHLKNILFSKPLFSGSFKVISNSKHPFIEDIYHKEHYRNDNYDIYYVSEDFSYELLKNKYPYLNIKLEYNIDKIMKKIEKNLDVHYIEKNITADYIILKYGFEKYKVNGIVGQIIFDISIGIHKNHDLMLPIINKAIDEIGKTKLKTIVDEYKIEEYEVNSVVNTYLIIGIVLLLLLIILLIYYISVLKQKHNLEKKYNEKALETEKIFNFTPTPLCFVDENRKIIRRNSSFIELLGFNENEVSTVDEWYEKAYPNVEYRKKVIQKWNENIENAKRNKNGFIKDDIYSVQCADGKIKNLSIAGVIHNGGIIVTFIDLTDLVHEKEKFESILNNATDCIHILDTNGNIVMCSQSFADILDYTKEEALTLNIQDWETSPLFKNKNYLKNLMGKENTYQSQHKKKDGTLFNIHARVKPIKMDGKTFYYVSSRDITDLIKYEELKETQKNLNEAQKIAKLGSWKFNLSVRKLNCTDEVFNIFEVNKNSFKPSLKKFLNIVYPDDRQAIKKAYKNSLEVKEAYEIDHRIIMPNGTIKWVKQRCYTTFDENNKPLVSYGIIQDITSQKLQQNQMNDYLKTLELSMHIAKIGAWKFDLINYKLEASKERKMIFDVDTQSDFSLENNIKMIHFDDKENYISTFKNSIKFENIYGIDYKIILNNGQVKYLSENWEFIYDKNNRAVELIGITKDITEEVLSKQKEQKQQAMIVHQNRLAQLGEMVSMIAHQWKQPLNGLSIWKSNLIDYVTNKVGNDDNIEMISDKINSSITYMSNTIDNFRNFYKVDKKKHEFNLSNAILNILNIIEGNFKDNQICLDISLDEKIILNSFESELQQIVLVLVSNSIEAMKESKIKNLKIKSFKENNNIYLIVEDSGMGIPKEIQAKVFDPYFTTKNELNGTGLGLYMAKMILEKNFGGNISFETTFNKGTKFKIIIPFENNYNIDDSLLQLRK